MMPIKFSEIKRYDFFENCYAENAPAGLAVFDRDQKYIGMITNSGFSLYTGYKYSEKIQRELAKRKIMYWDEDMAIEIQTQRLLNL